MAIAQCRGRAQWPVKLKQLSLRSGDVDQELRMGGVDGRVSRYGRQHHWQPQPRRLGRLQLHET
jgi:hypothetical protein